MKIHSLEQETEFATLSVSQLETSLLGSKELYGNYQEPIRGQEQVSAILDTPLHLVGMNCHLSYWRRSFYRREVDMPVTTFLEKRELATVACTSVTPRPSYSNTHYVWLPLQITWKVQLV